MAASEKDADDILLHLILPNAFRDKHGTRVGQARDKPSSHVKAQLHACFCPQWDNGTRDFAFFYIFLLPLSPYPYPSYFFTNFAKVLVPLSHREETPARYPCFMGQAPCPSLVPLVPKKRGQPKPAPRTSLLSVVTPTVSHDSALVPRPRTRASRLGDSPDGRTRPQSAVPWRCAIPRCGPP